ncbi:MAG: patatin-like phospholipase family protein [Candidatus Paracaedibacteraceae bacterium]|nr:patatin-like phospholipase family protein [Candidatus Paracaedibacteraceae bacterium]
MFINIKHISKYLNIYSILFFFIHLESVNACAVQNDFGLLIPPPITQTYILPAHAELQKETQPQKKVRLLSLDGGGVRGIIEARILQHIEENLEKPICEIFHLVGGTSAGGILATFLTAPSEGDPTKPKYSARDLVNILLERSEELFSPQYSSLNGLLGPKYDSEKFRSVTHEYLGDDITSHTVIPTAVVTYNIVNQNFKIITSWENESTFTKVDAISATSAAASFFRPCFAHPVAGKANPYVLTDGGTGANNPALSVLSKGRDLYPEATSFEVVSIGSGKANKPLYYKNMKDAGIIKWAPHLVRIFTNAQAENDHEFLKNMFSPKQDSHGIPHTIFSGDYTRWTPRLNPENSKMDNTDPTNLRELIRIADDYIDLRKDDFNLLLNRLRCEKEVF